MQILVKSCRLILCSRNVSFWRRLNPLWFFCRYVLFAGESACLAWRGLAWQLTWHQRVGVALVW